MDGLVLEPPIGGYDEHMPSPPTQTKPQYQRLTLPKTMKEHPKSAAFEAIRLLKTYGNKFVTKDGWTLLHRSATSTPAHIYVMANNAVPINVQNSNGDTALHIAVRRGNFETTEALLQCCADLSIRNKMGQVPADLATGDIADLLAKFEPDPILSLYRQDSKSLIRLLRMYWCNMHCIVKGGAVTALLKGKSRRLARIVPLLWCNVDSTVKDGMSLLQLAMDRVNDVEEDPRMVDCCRVLHDFRPASELIHCVLSEDVQRLHSILRELRGFAVNVRFKDRYGKTLLSHAIESNNLEVVQMLVNAGARINGIRVRETARSQHTVPLFHKTLKKDVKPKIAHFIHAQMDSREMAEKDRHGNTALLRTVEEGASEKLIDWLLVADHGNNLTHRNQNGMNARELAVSKGRSDIVQTIDKFVLQQRGKFFLVNLPVHFYGLDNLQFTDEQIGKTLFEVVEEGKDKEDKKSLRLYNEIEERGILLFKAAAEGDIKTVMKLNAANFQDKNGYTALTRAIVYHQLDVAKYLCTSRPDLKLMPDNCNRYPLHYACALPDEHNKQFVRLLLEKNPEYLEKTMDKDGMFPAEYLSKRGSPEVQQMLADARTLDAFGREGSPLAGLPAGSVAASNSQR